MPENLKKFTVVISIPWDNHAVEDVLQLFAADKKEAKLKAQRWLLSAYAFTVHEGHLDEDDFEEEVVIHRLGEEKEGGVL